MAFCNNQLYPAYPLLSIVLESLKMQINKKWCPKYLGKNEVNGSLGYPNIFYDPIKSILLHTIPSSLILQVDSNFVHELSLAIWLEFTEKTLPRRMSLQEYLKNGSISTIWHWQIKVQGVALEAIFSTLELGSEEFYVEMKT